MSVAAGDRPGTPASVGTPTAEASASAGLPAPPSEKFTVDNVQFLSQMLEQLHPETDDPDPLVDAMRELVEVVVWGDKYNEAIVDRFMEANTIAFFATAVDNDRAHVRVKTQCFQCITILLGNLSQQPSIYYVMSNNYINRVIASPSLDFSNDEIVSNYISFTKALSLKLNSELVHFFFDGQRNAFPLYDHSVRLLNHSDRLVRTSVRQIVANVLEIKEPTVHEYVKAKIPEFVDGTSKHIIQTVTTLAKSMAKAEAAQTCLPVPVIDGIVEDANDDFYFFNDLHGVCPESLQQAVVQSLSSNLASPLSWVAREETHPAWAMVLSNWVRINTIRPLQVQSLMLRPAAVASELLSAPNRIAQHPCAISLMSNVVAQWEKMPPTDREALRDLAAEANEPFLTAACVDSIMLGVRSMLWKPRDRAAYLCALALDTAVRVSRIARGFAAIKDSKDCEATLEECKATMCNDGEPQLRRSLCATVWWLQQHVLTDLESAAGGPSREDDPGARASDDSDDSDAAENNANSQTGVEDVADVRTPQQTAAPDTDALLTPQRANEDDDSTLADAPPLATVSFDVPPEVSPQADGDVPSVAMVGSRRHRARTVAEPMAAAAGDAGGDHSPSSTFLQRGATNSSPDLLHDAEERRIFEVNADAMFTTIASMVASNTPSWLNPIKQSMSRAGRDVQYLSWAKLPALTGAEKRRLYVTCLALARSTVAVTAAGGTFRKNAAAAWGFDARFEGVAKSSAVGSDSIAHLRPVDCVPTQVCAANDVDASTSPPLDKTQAGIKGLSFYIGDYLHLSLVGGQLALVDFSGRPPAMTDGGDAGSTTASRNFLPTEGEPDGAGRVALVLPLTWCCAIVESQRPFRLRIVTECEDASLVPVRELGLVLRDRGLCRAVAARFNDASLAVRDLCREAVAEFLNKPLDD